MAVFRERPVSERKSYSKFGLLLASAAISIGVICPCREGALSCCDGTTRRKTTWRFQTKPMVSRTLSRIEKSATDWCCLDMSKWG